jgi:hypothetical protein
VIDSGTVAGVPTFASRGADSASSSPFSSGSVCAVLASEPYDEKDYYRDYREYLLAVGGTKA